ncbi:MAG: cobaltochelatase [Beijerinckiaceae bacterium]|nr:MAG: cobaltochelatase [Beijerinckiaceae bacterium]
MHVVFREKHGLDEAETPVDLGQDPADLVVLSFSDSDLSAFAAGWRSGRAHLPSLRLANLIALRHPLSVDTYLEQTLSRAKGVLIRLIGGESYWPYGLAEVHALAQAKGIALAVLPADGRPDARLSAFSTLPEAVLSRLSMLCDAGGARAAEIALAELAHAAGIGPAPTGFATQIPACGWYSPEAGVIPPPAPCAELAVVVFYRSYLTAADTGPVDALITALRARGFTALGLFAPSLKGESAATIMRELARLEPVALINATAFSAKGPEGVSPLDAAGCPVFQVALATIRRDDWSGDERGLPPTDLAMHVVLPEVDGRIFAGVASFKTMQPRDPDLQCALFSHQAEPERIAAIADRVSAWRKLAQRSPEAKRIVMVLSTYPGKNHQMAHAVGLDPLASLEAMLADLAATGHAVEPRPPEQGFAAALQYETLDFPLEAYHAALATLPVDLREKLGKSWGEAEADPQVVAGAFRFPALWQGNALVALQPERGERALREDDYHDTARVPRHAYVAFYLWLNTLEIDALVHIGAHGTLEWLPGKAVALSGTCWPEALTGAMPVLYPFIVNDPGEAAQAKRRIGAVTLGHLPPPLIDASVPEALSRLEILLDEYSTADGLSPARRDRLVADIRSEASARGVEADLGIPPGASAAEALVRIDRFVCDIKESRFGDGLHIFGRGACGAEEQAGLNLALAGRRVPAGPSGSPNRVREDILPTGRNLFSVDPRAVPSHAAHAQGVKLAEELLRRHLQDHGDWPRALVVDLWGSATMRSAGEEFAMALHLAGLAPLWDSGSARVSGFEILPPALLDRPRIDVTLRVSGLFRDVFPDLARMFEAASVALARRQEEGAENPYITRGPRVFGPEPGRYGLDMGDLSGDFSAAARHAAGEAWLRASSFAIDAEGRSSPARAALEARVLGSDVFVHVQDLPETDLLLAMDYAAHEGGFAAAVARLGGAAPTLYHLDSTRPETPRARDLTEEIARVTRARATAPEWLDGMMRHGFRGAAEIAGTLDHLAAFAHLTHAVPDHLLDLYFEATLGREDIVAFMTRENPGALAAMRGTFAALAASGLWQTRRNTIRAALEGGA